MKQINKSIITYEIEEGFMIDVIDMKEAWIYHKNYGIKLHMFTLNESTGRFLDIVSNNIDEYKEFYKEEYMNE